MGTTSPTAKLDVEGGNIQIGGGYNLLITASDSGVGFGNGSSINRRASDGSLLITGGQANIVVAPAGNTIFSSGNVGIGTTAPAINLDARGVNAATKATIGASNSDNTSYLSLWSGTSTANQTPAVIFPTGTSLRFGAGDYAGAVSYTERMRIDSSGNVGIGTTTPDALLNLNQGFVNGSIGIPLHLHDDTANATVAGTGYGIRLTYGAAGAPSDFGMVGGYGDGTSIGAGIWGAAHSGSPNLFVKSGGNVGVGMTSPVVTLQAGSGGNTVGIEGRTDGANIAGAGAANYSRIGGFMGSNPIPAAAIGFGFQGGSGQRGALEFLTKTANDDTTQPTVQMVIDETGNVGIGTTGPSRNLSLQTGAAGTDTYMSFMAGGSEKTVIGDEESPTPKRPFIIYDTAASAYRFVLDANGNVGIGTTTPLGLLHIAAPDDGVSAAIAIRQANNGAYGFDLALARISHSPRDEARIWVRDS